MRGGDGAGTLLGGNWHRRKGGQRQERGAKVSGKGDREDTGQRVGKSEGPGGRERSKMVKEGWGAQSQVGAVAQTGGEGRGVPSQA